MTTFNRPPWQDKPAGQDDHSVLLAWEAELEAERAPIPTCVCYDVATCEYGPNFPCDVCRSRDLGSIDVDGYDDKRETPGQVA